MVKVQLEDKDFESRKAYFGLGAHEVYIEKIEKVTPDSGSPYLNVSVLGVQDEKEVRDDVRAYISDAAAPYTVSTLARIAVHNKKTDKEKQAVRDAFKEIDTDEIDQKFLDKFKDMQAWILTEENLNAPRDNGGYFWRSSLYSYEPKPKKITAESLVSEGGTEITKENLGEIPF